MANIEDLLTFNNDFTFLCSNIRKITINKSRKKVIDFYWKAVHPFAQELPHLKELNSIMDEIGDAKFEWDKLELRRISKLFSNMVKLTKKSDFNKSRVVVHHLRSLEDMFDDYILLKKRDEIIQENTLRKMTLHKVIVN